MIHSLDGKKEGADAPSPSDTLLCMRASQQDGFTHGYLKAIMDACETIRNLRGNEEPWDLIHALTGLALRNARP